MHRWKTRARVVVVLLMLASFTSYRWFMRVEPLNSDDMILFNCSVDATNGTHWLFQSRPNPVLSHQALRIGLLPFSVPAILTFGPTSLAYYLTPLFFSLCGFGLTWYIMHSEIHPGFALSFAVIHIVLPFEIIDSSLFLVDLPAAVTGLLCLVLIAVWSGRPDGDARSVAIRGS